MIWSMIKISVYIPKTSYGAQNPKNMKKYITIIITVLSTLHLSSQHGIVTTTSSCDEDNNGTIHILLDYPSGLLGYGNFGPPHNVEYYNTTIQGGYYLTSYDKEFVMEGMAPGEYDITVSLSSTVDLNLCAIIERTVNIKIQDIIPGCADGDGYVEILVTGGIPPYTYNWSNGDTEEDLSEVAPGSYTITVTDADDCKSIESVDVPDRLPEIVYGIEHNCTQGDEQGRILIYTQEGYTYEWQSTIGQTIEFPGYSIKSNLPNGQICINIIDDNTSCTKEHCFYIDSEDEIKVCCIEEKDPCVSTPDGEISFDFYDPNELYSGNSLFPTPNITWSDGTEYNGLKSREQLGPGVYTATITTQCYSKVLTFDLDYDCECPAFKEVELAMLWACSRDGDEGAAVVLSPDYPLQSNPVRANRYSDYDWAGDHPVNVHWQKNRVTGLKPGNYTVTITDKISNCQTTKDFTIGIEQPIRLSYQEVQPSCPHEGTGSISFNYSGGTKNYNSHVPYDVIWTDLPGLHPDQGDLYRNNLLPGQYCVTVSSNCFEEVFCFDVPAIEIIAHFTPSYSTVGCESNSLRVEASGTNPPYTYMWNNRSEEDEIENIPLGLYRVTVTDAGGCTAEFSHELYPVTIVEQTNACPGLEDGSVVVRIDNPSNYPTTVYVEYGSPCPDCGHNFEFPIVVDDPSQPVEFEVNHLRGDIEYVLVVSQQLPNGEICRFRFSFSIDEDDHNKTFVRADPLDEEGYAFDCVYHIECKGNDILQGLHELSRYEAKDPCENYHASGFGDRLLNGFSNSIDCGSVDIFCDDELINTVEIESVKARAGQYRQLIQDMYGYDIFPDGQSSDGYGNPCRRMSFCPQDPENCYTMSWGGNLGGGSYQGYEGPDENGCVKVKCNTFFVGIHTYEICGVDYVPDFLRHYIVTNNRFGFNINYSDTLDNRSCNEVENNARQLWENDAELLKEYGEAYENSELRKFLLSIEPSNQFNSVDPINCTQVRYCTNDFSITWDNFDSVDCFEIDQELYEQVGENYAHGWDGPCHGVNGVENGIPGIWILCEDPDCEEPVVPNRPCLKPRFVSSLYSDLNFKCESGPTHTQYVTKQKQNTDFQSFSLLQDSYGNTYTNGIYKSIDKTYYHYIQEEKYKLKLSSTVLHAYEFPEGDYSFYVLQDSMISEAITILTGNPDDFQEQSIQASDSLWIEKFTRISDELFVVKASFEGQFKYNSDVLSTSNTRSQILMHVDNYGQLIDHTIVNTDSDSYGEEIKSGTDNLIYKTTRNGQVIYVDGIPQGGQAIGSIVETSIKDGSAVTNTNLRLTGDLNLTAYTSEKAGKDRYYVVTGNSGSIFYNNSRKKIVQELSSYIIKVSGTKLSWINEIEIENIYGFVPNIEVDENENIYVGMNTFSGDGDSFPTRGLGGLDIAVLVFNKSGSVVKDYFYSSSSTEILVDIHLTKNILFLGGTMSGNAEKRTIGELRYYNFSGSQQHGFTSFIYLDSNDNFEGAGCDDVCDVDILFDFENCVVNYSLVGSYANDYYLTIQFPSGQKTPVGYRAEGAYTFDYFTEVGEFRFIFESTNMLCDDVTYSVVVSGACIDSGDICSSINGSASGTGDWNGSYTSDGDGILSIYFNTYQVPDQLLIYQNSVLVFDSYAYSSSRDQSQIDQLYPNCGAVGGNVPLYVDLAILQNDYIELFVVGDNCDALYTQWNLDALCSSNSQSQILESRHRDDVDLEELLTKKGSQELLDFNYYPNPTNGMIWLDMPFNCDYSISLYSTFNIELDSWKLNGSSTDLNLSKFDSGVYLLSVQCGQSIVTKKIVILE